MRRSWILLPLGVLLSFSLYSSLAVAVAPTELSPAERGELENRLERFYKQRESPPRSIDSEIMSEATPKFGVRTGKREFPNQFLKLKNTKTKQLNQQDPLLERAQVKGTERFQKHYCENFLAKRFPGIDCDERARGTEYWSSIQKQDLVRELARTWTDVTENLDEIPVVGKIEHDAWSDDYWRTRWGITSFRYSQNDPKNEFKNYTEAVNSFHQPKEWGTAVQLPMIELAKKVLSWSPSEKYDLSVGDLNFTLTNQQKNEGKDSIGPKGDVEDWMGICHGWAPAALVVDRPRKPVTVTGPSGLPVTWYPNDLKSMVTLNWANGSYPSTQAGLRCNVKKTQTFPNGRLKQQQCFDNNPASFHLALGNMIGRAKVGFVMDKTFDYEVWNQPVVSYEFTYFNPLDHRKRSKNWKEVLVPYNKNFKARDRFQKPLTRGDMNPRGLRTQDSKVTAVVGVIATVVYLSEITPQHTPGVQPDELLRETYTYDLEFEGRRRNLTVSGGEWHNNAHPDFLWMPEKDTVAYLDVDNIQLNYSGNEAPSQLLTNTAQHQASGNGYPLYQVVQELLKKAR